VRARGGGGHSTTLSSMALGARGHVMELHFERGVGMTTGCAGWMDGFSPYCVEEGDVDAGWGGRCVILVVCLFDFELF